MAIKVNGTTVINDSRALQNIASIDATTAAAIGAGGVGGGTTLLSTTTLSGAYEVSISSLDLSDYDLLYIFGIEIKGGGYYDNIHVKASGQTTNFRNFAGRVQGSNPNTIGRLGVVIDLNTGYGSGGAIATDTGYNTYYYGLVGAPETGITRSTTTIVIGHSEGQSTNWQQGTVKVYGA